MNPNQQQNTFLDLFKGNERMLFIVGGVSIVFIIIIVTIIRMNSAMQPMEPGVAPTPTQGASGATSIPLQNDQSTSFQEQAVIEEQVRPQLASKITISYTVAKIKTYEENWAIMEVTAAQTDPAHVVIRKQNEKWIVVLGPGTYFEEAQLRNIGAPESLIREVNGLL